MGLIEAEVLKKDLDAEIIFDSRDRYRVRDLIDIQPTLETESVKHGQWIEDKDRRFHWHCSECDYVIGVMKMDANYCPNCGAKMGEQEHGRWINNGNNTWSCSLCHSWLPDEQHYYARYCLFCGARMEEQE